MTSKTTRRAILAGAAVLPALAIPAAASSADPAYSAIERYKAFDVEATAFSEQEPELQSPEHPAWEVKREADMDKFNALRDAMLQTVPTTRAGATALIIAASTHYAGDGYIDSEDAMILLDTLAKAVQS